MKPRIYFPALALVAGILLYGSGVFANVDMGYEQRACSKEKHFVQPVTNGSCYGTIIGRGTEDILLRGDGDTVKHRYPQGCKNIDWKEENPEWKTKTCAPTYACLDNTGIDLSNASFISNQEQPYSNAPEVTPPIFPLDKNYTRDIVFANNASVSDTADACQYTCNDGYKLSNGPCSAGTGGGGTTTTTPVNTYFGGMYGGPSYNNPITNAQSCPTGYTATQISGTANLDYALYICTRSAGATTTTTTTTTTGTNVCPDRISDIQIVEKQGNIKINNYRVQAQCPNNTIAIGGTCETDMLASGSYNPSGYDKIVNGRYFTCVARHDANSSNGNIASKLTASAICAKYAPNNYQGSILSQLQTVSKKTNIRIGLYSGEATCPDDTEVIGGTCETDMRPSGSYNPSGYDQKIIGKKFKCIARHDSGSGNGYTPSELTVTALCAKFQTPVASTKGFNNVRKVSEQTDIKIGFYSGEATCPNDTEVIGGTCETDMRPSGSYNPSGYDEKIIGNKFKCIARHDATSANGNIASKLTVSALCAKEVSVGLSCSTTTTTGSNPPPADQYWDFGGMWGTGGTLSGFVRDVNPYTGSNSCPTGYTQTQVLGTPNLDYTLYYCWKARTTVPTEDFGGAWGMYSTVPGQWGGTDYPNPVTDNGSCPTGFQTKVGWGTDNVDWLLRWCYKGTTQQQSEQWIAYATPYYIYLTKTPVAPTTIGGKTFYIYNPEKVIAIASMSKATFLANPENAIKNAPTISVGNTPLTSRHIFNLAQLESETPTIQNTTIDNLDIAIENRYIRTQNQVGATSCHTNNNAVHAPGTGYALGGDIYAPITDSDSNIGYAKSEVLGTYTLTTGTSTTTTTTTTSTTSSGFSCTAAPTVTIAAPTGTMAGVTATLKFNTLTPNTTIAVDNQGSGYSTAPNATITVPNNGTCTPYTPSIKTVVTGGKITGASLQVLAPTVEVARGTLEPNKLYFAVIEGGAGYTTPPTVTIGGLTGCTIPSVPATIVKLNNRGSLTTIGPNNGIDGFDIPSTCTGTPTVTVSAPPALAANIVCPTGTTATVPEPTGDVNGSTATVTVALNGGNLTATVTDGGSGYTSAPAVTVTGGTCNKTPSATAVIDPATKKVTAINFSFTGTTAYAISNATGTAAAIPTNGGGSGYTSAPAVTVTGGVCTTRPVATATISSAGVVTGVTLSGAVGCTVAPILTIAPPTLSCTAGATVKKCIPLVCTGPSPSNAIYCENDKNIAGHEDQPNVHRSDATQCTSNAKCEWYCPAATPFYCESSNTCVASQNECGQTNTCKTSAPSELKTETDLPLIQCDAINATSTHFRYKITKTGGTANDTYISPLFTVGTSVKHPTTFYAGTYTVTCLYGTAANTNSTLTDYGMTPDATCNKTMTVKDDANGCSRIYPYRGSTLSDEMSSPSAFDASFRCGSRQTVTNTADTKAYRLQIGTGDPAFLAYDRTITDLFAGLAIGPVSTQTQNYNFTSGTDVSCAAKVGDGYSTNPSCQLRTCTGSSCANPQTFIVVPSEEITCTNQDSISYDVGCNPASPDYTQCLQWIYAGTPTSGNTYTRNAKIKVNNVEQDIYFQCKIDTPEGALGPVKTCTIQLPTGGMPVTIFAGDASTTNNTTNYSFQTTAYTLKKDTGKPVGSIAYYTNYSNGVTLSQDQYDYWQKQPITAVITCTDKASTGANGEPTTNGETDGPGCACATTLTNLTNTTPTATEQAEIDQWSLGLPSTNTNIGPDIMTYSRVINNNKGALISLKVKDTAGNKSTDPLTANFGIDSTPPRLTATKTANSVTLSFADNAVGDSGIWKSHDTTPVNTGILKGGENNKILYRVGPKSQLATLEFGEKCAPMPDVQTAYFKYSETSSAPTTQTLTLPSFDVNNNIVAYCVQDNAGNINRGYYPNNLTGCFSSSAMPTIPTLSPSTLASHYAPFLKTKLTSTTLSNNEKYGYSFSENPTNASCFRGILSTNITTLVTNQLNPRPAGEITLDNWTTKLSTIKNTTTPNGNGYYYYDLGTTTNNTLTITAPTGTGTKSVIVEGGNIQINSNIEYTGTGKTLLLIARKNSAGQGGNIYINPTVTRVDAIIIADGGSLMNGTTTNGTTTTKNWISHATDLTNRLTINGRVYSYNTRGGSITPQATPGTDFDPITTNIGKYFDTTSATTPLVTTGTPTQAATYDLERLRVMLSDGNSQCTTHVNYQAFTTTNLPALLIKPSGFGGGSCSF